MKKVLLALFLIFATAAAHAQNGPDSSVSSPAATWHTTSFCPSGCDSSATTYTAITQQAQIPPSYFGMHLRDNLNVSWPPVYSAACRTWDGTNGGSATTVPQWQYIETGRGTYDFTTLDAVIANCVAHGTDIEITFAGVPGWANSNTGRSHPPTLLQDLYDFQTTVVQRYAGLYPTLPKYYETWNEHDLISDITGWWAGTNAQMCSIAQSLYAIVHANDPMALVVLPTVSGNGNNAQSVQDAYLALGCGQYADIMAAHGYLTTPTNLETEFNLVKTYQNMFNAYGQSAKPFWITEGDIGNISANTDPMLISAGPAIYNLLIGCSGAVARNYYYQYDNPFGFGRLWSGSARGVNISGVGYIQAEKWLIGSTCTTPIARQAATNQIPNSDPSTASIGLIATNLPPGWSVGSNDTAHGVAYNITSVGTSGGINYFALRVSGTADAGGGGKLQVFMSTATAIAATLGQSWTVGMYQSLADATVYPAGLTFQIGWQENAANGSQTGTQVVYQSIPYNIALASQQQVFTTATTNASVARVQPQFYIRYPLLTAMDFTVLIGTPSMDTGTIWRGTITKPNPAGYQADIIWDASCTTTSCLQTPVSAGSYTYCRDITGLGCVITGGNVTPTHQPMIVENTQWKGLLSP